LTTVPLEGGTKKTISKQPVFSRFDLSPDGKFAAFATYHLGEPKEKLALQAIDSNKFSSFWISSALGGTRQRYWIDSLCPRW